MAMYLFIYTLIGFALAYFIIPSEPKLFRQHFYLKTAIFILTWPISAITYFIILGSI